MKVCVLWLNPLVDVVRGGCVTLVTLAFYCCL